MCVSCDEAGDGSFSGEESSLNKFDVRIFVAIVNEGPNTFCRVLRKEDSGGLMSLFDWSVVWLVCRDADVKDEVLGIDSGFECVLDGVVVFRLILIRVKPMPKIVVRAKANEAMTHPKLVPSSSNLEALLGRGGTGSGGISTCGGDGTGGGIALV